MKAWMIVDKKGKPLTDVCCCKGQIPVFSRRQDALVELLPEEGERVIKIEIPIINKKGGNKE